MWLDFVATPPDLNIAARHTSNTKSSNTVAVARRNARAGLYLASS